MSNKLYNKNIKENAIKMLLEGSTYQEVADHMGMTIGTVHNWYKKYLDDTGINRMAGGNISSAAIKGLELRVSHLEDRLIKVGNSLRKSIKKTINED